MSPKKIREWSTSTGKDAHIITVKGMEIKPKTRYYFSPTRLVIMKNGDRDMCR